MAPLIECVPNFSAGRDRRVVEQIAAAIGAVPGAHVLDTHLNPDHNRSVITFAGPASSVQEAAVRAVGKAASLIDLNRHRGEHPRIGAADVVPIVPLEEATLADCVPVALRVGKEIWEQWGIPVYYYESAALRPERKNLENVRRGGFEKLREMVASDPSRWPDVGGPRLHPNAGATAVGARGILIAFNVNLNSNDLHAARAIARAIRASGGSLPAVKAMGVLLRSQSDAGLAGQAQVSINLSDWKQTSLGEVFRAVEREGSRLGLAIHSSELVGLVPAQALEGITPEELRLAEFGPEKILEHRLAEGLKRN